MILDIGLFLFSFFWGGSYFLSWDSETVPWYLDRIFSLSKKNICLCSWRCLALPPAHRTFKWYSPLCIFRLTDSRNAAAAKSLQSCPTLFDLTDGSPPGSPVPGILQARVLEWVAISFSNAWKWKVKMKLLSRAQLLATPWTVARQAPRPRGFSKQDYWSGLPLPTRISVPNPFRSVF